MNPDNTPPAGDVGALPEPPGTLQAWLHRCVDIIEMNVTDFTAELGSPDCDWFLAEDAIWTVDDQVLVATLPPDRPAFGQFLLRQDPYTAMARVRAYRAILAVHVPAGPDGSTTGSGCRGCGTAAGEWVTAHTDDCPTLRALALAF